MTTNYYIEQQEYYAPKRVTREDLERENAQMRAVIAEQKEVIERLSALADKWNTECDEMREDNKRLDAVAAEQSALIEKLAEALKQFAYYAEFNQISGYKEALQQYELWNESK